MLHASRLNQTVLAFDPGASSGWALIKIEPREEKHGIIPLTVLALGTDPKQALRLLPADRIDAILIEDQYRGKASEASRTTLSQRAGYLAGLAAGVGYPEERMYFITPQAWYRALGQGQAITKQVCLNRIEDCLTNEERYLLDQKTPKSDVARLDVLAAIGIGWSYPFLSATTLTRGRKLVMKKKPKLQLKKRAWTGKGTRKR